MSFKVNEPAPSKSNRIMNKNKIYEISKVFALVTFGLLIKSFSDNTGISYCALPVAVPLLMAGGGILSSVFGRKKKVAPPPKPVGLFDVDPLTGQTQANKQGAGLLDYYRQNVPGFIQLQNEFGPQLMNQMFDQSGSFLGKQSQLERQAALQAGKNVADIRARELGTMRKQAPLTRGLMDALSPEQARAIQLQQAATERAQGLESEFQAASKPYSGMFGTMAEEAFARRGTLSPEEQRATEQQARQASAASGRLGGNAAIAAEIQNREAAKAARRQEASGAAGLASANLFQTEAQRAALRGEAERVGQNLYGMAGEFYTKPGLNLLSNAPLGYKLGTVGAASAIAGGPAASGAFDYNLPLSLGQESAGMQNQYNQAVYQTNLANQQAKAQMWSNIGSSMMGAGMGSMGGASGSNFSSFLGSGNYGNAGTAFGNMGREAMGMPLRAYTV